MIIPIDQWYPINITIIIDSLIHPYRDALLCSILDGVRASGNRDICVKMSRTVRGQRLGPLHLPVDEEVESQYLRYISNTPQGIKFSEAVRKFNANVGYSGLNHAVTQEVCVVTDQILLPWIKGMGCSLESTSKHFDIPHQREGQTEVKRPPRIYCTYVCSSMCDLWLLGFVCREQGEVDQRCSHGSIVERGRPDLPP